MKALKKNTWKVGLILAALGLSGPATAQEDPTRIGAGQLPYVLIIMDTSGSVEWTDKGDERYPEGPVINAGSYAEWVPGTPMGIADPTTGEPTHASTPYRFGSCYVWEPTEGADCNEYRRPSWNANPSAPSNWKISDFSPLMQQRYGWMQGDGTTWDGLRMSPDSQPRHVTLKEILTGDMLLHRTDQAGQPTSALDPLTNGPGCWFVPRQRFATVQSADFGDQIYCTDDVPSLGISKVSGADHFNELPDSDEPRPHFQEVFDSQLTNGLLDLHATNALFAVAQLDGYKDEVANWNGKLNDPWTNAPSDSLTSHPTVATRTSVASEDDSANYNLGIYRVTGPTKLEIPQSYLTQLSSYVQIALVDSGWVAKDGDFTDLKLKIKDNKPAGLGITFDKKLEKYVDKEYQLGHQPIARATPLAAAIMDAREFFREDDRFTKDKFAQCRPKQIIVVTDGYPEPEAPGGAGNQIGATALTEAFDYDPLRYFYNVAETEIADLVADMAIPPGVPDDRYSPRVHIVGLSSADDAVQRHDIANKLAAMAMEGNTCAGAYLDDSWKTANGCDPNTQACLVDVDPAYHYTYTLPDGTTYNCEHPALFLTRNDRVIIDEALANVFNAIVSGAGIASRTRAVVTNNLDDTTLGAGGQYRLFSGVEIGGGQFWRGILNRQTLGCEDAGGRAYDTDADTAAGLGGINAPEHLHWQVAEQVNCPLVNGECQNPEDNRRIFTTIVDGTVYDYTNRKFTVADGSHNLFNFVYKAYSQPSTNDDDFRDHALPGVVSNAGSLVGTRVPLAFDTISAALDDTSDASWVAPGSFNSFMGVADQASYEHVVDVYRGRVAAKRKLLPSDSRVLGGILNSTPAVVGPPGLDLPIESYRRFRAQYGDRPTMLYVSSTEGLLHAIYTGELVNRVPVRPMNSNHDWAAGTDKVDVSKGADQQREAWAYIPNMFLTQMSSSVSSQGYFMDASPVVKDVRLCQRNAAHNQNPQACQVLKTTGILEDKQMWRTVLVQGLGSAGAGYFAMDVTRTGGLAPNAMTRTVDLPDPVAHWEFDREWERAQVTWLDANCESARVYPGSSQESDYWDTNGDCANDKEFWN